MRHWALQRHRLKHIEGWCCWWRHCNTLHPSVNTLQHTATQCNIELYRGTGWKISRADDVDGGTATHSTHCNTLQTHCNTLQHNAILISTEAQAERYRGLMMLIEELQSWAVYMWRDSFICVTWLIHMCDVTHWCCWTHIICVTWLIHMYKVTHSYICHVTHSYI